MMPRFIVMGLLSVSLSVANVGCMGRLFSEGMATVTGASGKVVYITKGTDLSKYKVLKMENVSVSPGLKVPAEMTNLLRSDFIKVAEKKGLKGTGSPAMKLSAEIIHYETGGVVDEAIGPLVEVIVRCRLVDAGTNQLLSEANLIGRSKATTSSGEKTLAEGAGKAMSKWLKEHGLKGGDEKEKE